MMSANGESGGKRTMRWVQVSLVVGLCVFALTHWAHAETLYAKKPDVQVTAEPSPLSRVIATLAMGDAVDVLQKRGRVYRIRLLNGDMGWVFKFKLSAEKPSRDGKAGSLFAGLSGGSSISVREARTAGSIRGLKRVSEQYVRTKQIDPVHMKSVERMEQRTLSQKRLMRFKRRGTLGEFSGGGQ